MANLSESPLWEPTIHEIGVEEYVAGGPSGPANAQARQLANRTMYLLVLCEDLLEARAGAPSLAGRLASLQDAVDAVSGTSTPILDSTKVAMTVAGGGQMQAGMVTTNALGNATITFPVPFAHVCISCVLTPQGAASGDVVPVVTSTTKDNTVIQAKPSTTYSWVALGR